jgi:hypothetical protein
MTSRENRTSKILIIGSYLVFDILNSYYLARYEVLPVGLMNIKPSRLLCHADWYTVTDITKYRNVSS